MNAATIAALDYVRNLSGENFWGAVTLKFEDGGIVHVRQEENLKPSELSGKPRRTNGNAS